MYVARFAYDVLPVNRQRALDFIRREAEAARANGFTARVLIPMTRGIGAPALQFEVELPSLDKLDEFRTSGVGNDQATQEWIRAFSEILLTPPAVEIYRIDEPRAPA